MVVRRKLQTAKPLAIWRSGFALSLLAQILVLRQMWQGRFWLLSRDVETFQGLWYLHTAAKVTFVLALALLFCAVVERRFNQPALLSRRWIWALSLLHIGALMALMGILPTLPTVSHDPQMTAGEMWRYPATSLLFLGWQGTAVMLIAPHSLITGLRLRTSAFVLCAMVSAVILFANNRALVDILRAVVENSTLSLAVAFYSWFGEVQPVLSLRDGAPLLAAPNFAILIGAPCAGYQGMLASATIMGGLIMLEWPRLRHGRAVILGLAAIGGIFVLNALRIALLFYIGVRFSPKMALDGFHSYAGTLSLLLVVGVAMLALQCRGLRQANHVQTISGRLARNDRGDVEAGNLILPLALYLGLGMVTGLFIAGFDWTYPLLATGGLVLLVVWRAEVQREFLGEGRAAAVAMGVLIYGLWLAMVPANPQADATFAVALNSVPLSVMLGWVIFRLIGFCLVVPVLEELAFRGGLMRLMAGKLGLLTGPRAAALMALALSSLSFGVMHMDVLAGTVAGAGFGLLVLQNGRAGNAIIAHVVTNSLLGTTAILRGHWSLF